MWRRKLVFILLSLWLVAGVIRLLPPLWAAEDSEQQTEVESTTELQEKLKQTQSRIEELEKKLSETRKTAKTLKQQIYYFDNQIRLTELKIRQLEQEIAQTKREIRELSDKISVLNLNLDELAAAMSERVKQAYKRRRVGVLGLFFSPDSFQLGLMRIKYLRLIQSHDQNLLLAMEQTRMNFSRQQEILADKKQQLARAKQKLAFQQQQLSSQKQEKQALLTATNNDEKRYQELLAKAIAEQKSIRQAINSLVKRLKDGTPVKKGDAIALMGNSGGKGGCSTAAHLHFEVTDSQGKHTNPAGYLKPDWPIKWDNAPDQPFGFSGTWDWPLTHPRITQGYGYTWWAKTGFYGGGPHTGIDMVDRADITIRAVADGTLYKGVASCRGYPMNYVAIKHDNGVISWYWHVQ